MTSFTDMKGDSWDVVFTLGELIRAKSRLGLTLVNLTKSDVEYNAIKNETTGKLILMGGRAKEDLERLTSDISLFLDALYLTVEAQAEKRGLDSSGFASVLDADAILAAIDAWHSELCLFGQSRANQPRARAAIQRWATASNKMLKKEQDKMLTMIEAEASKADTSLGLPTNAVISPESSASTP